MKFGFLEACRIYSRRWSQEAIFEEEKGMLGIGNARPTLFVSGKKMSYV